MEFDICANMFVSTHGALLAEPSTASDTLIAAFRKAFGEFKEAKEEEGEPERAATQVPNPYWLLELPFISDERILARVCAIMQQRFALLEAEHPRHEYVKTFSQKQSALYEDIRSKLGPTKRRISDEFGRVVGENRLKKLEITTPIWNGFGRSAFDHVLEARKVFAGDIRNLATMMMIIIAAFGTIEWTYHSKPASQGDFALVWAALATAVFSLLTCYAAWHKSHGAYSLYSSSNIQTLILHRSMGLNDTHEWLTNVEEYIRELDSLGITATEFDWKDKIRDRWTDPSGLNLVPSRVLPGV